MVGNNPGPVHTLAPFIRVGSPITLLSVTCRMKTLVIARQRAFRLPNDVRFLVTILGEFTTGCEMKLLSPHSPSDETELVERSLGGDRAAFAMIVDRYQGVVCGIAYSTCGDLGRSEELAQDTFVTAWRSLQKIKEPAKLRFWLIGIVRNLANNAVRKGHRIPTEGAEPLSMEVASPMDTPAAQAIGNEEAVIMWRALEVMPPLYREPMILFYREGQSIQALATSLDLTEELVRKRHSRGREMLEAHVSKSD